MWYAAHIITVFRYRDTQRARRQRKFHVWENIVLIEAASSEEAWRKAKEYGRKDAAHDDKTWRMNGVPAKLDYVGVRKLIDVVDPDTRPGHGTEVTYNKFNLSTRADLERLVNGDPVQVEYQE